MGISELEKAALVKKALSDERVRHMPLDQQRSLRETIFGRPTRVIGSSFLRLLSSTDVDALLDEALAPTEYERRNRK